MCVVTRGTLLTSLALRGDFEDPPGLEAAALVEQTVRSVVVEPVTWPSDGEVSEA
jgi:hypothetical protein